MRIIPRGFVDTVHSHGSVRYEFSDNVGVRRVMTMITPTFHLGGHSISMCQIMVAFTGKLLGIFIFSPKHHTNPL